MWQIDNNWIIINFDIEKIYFMNVRHLRYIFELCQFYPCRTYAIMLRNHINHSIQNVITIGYKSIEKHKVALWRSLEAR